MSYILTKDGNKFKPEGIAGTLPDNTTDAQTERILFFKSYVTGPQGAHYELLKERQHTDEDVKKAKGFLRSNFDVVSISILNSTF